MSDAVRIDEVADEEIEAALELAYHAFLNRPADDEEREANRRVLADAARVGARDGSDLVGLCAALALTITVPGGAALPCAGLTWAAVLPTHRRRGALRGMLTKLLSDAGAAGTPLAALWASEGGIYGRFGFGIGTSATSMTLDVTRPLAFRVPPASGRLRLLGPDDAFALIAPLYERLRRPGMLVRTQARWHDDVLRTGSSSSLTEVRVVLLEDAGYAIYRTRSGEDGGEVELQELVAQDGATEAALWSYLASIDLVATVRGGNRPVDDLLALLLVDPERVRTTDAYPALWLRVLDVVAAVERRGWAADVDLVLELTDALVPENAGTWSVIASDGRARCARTHAPPDLTLDVRELSAAYLGGTAVARLAAAGLVHEHAGGAVAALDAALATPRAPFIADGF